MGKGSVFPGLPRISIASCKAAETVGPSVETREWGAA